MPFHSVALPNDEKIDVQISDYIPDIATSVEAISSFCSSLLEEKVNSAGISSMIFSIFSKHGYKQMIAEIDRILEYDLSQDADNLQLLSELTVSIKTVLFIYTKFMTNLVESNVNSDSTTAFYGDKINPQIRAIVTKQMSRSDYNIDEVPQEGGQFEINHFIYLLQFITKGEFHHLFINIVQTKTVESFMEFAKLNTSEESSTLHNGSHA